MATLQELTLKMSQDLTANQRERDGQLERLERDRLAALHALPGSAPVLQQHARAKADADAARTESLAATDADLQAAERKASSTREAELRKADARMREADAATQKTRDEAVEKANAELKADFDRIDRTIPLGAANMFARQEAQRKRDEAVDAADRAFLKGSQDNKNQQQDDLRDALAGEVADSRVARDEANAARARAEGIFERALKTADTKLRLDLDAVPGASDVQADFDARKARINDESHRREEALFAEFSDAKKKIGTANA